MRASLSRVAWIAGALFAAAACAEADSHDAVSVAPENDGGTESPNRDTPDASIRQESGPGELPEIETCSAAGWCSTPLPDAEMQVSDIWPLANRAFALAGSEGSAWKILEWSAQAGWGAIDDGILNETPYGVPANVWAPNSDEVYVTMLRLGLVFGIPDDYGAYVFRGTRPVSPATKWSWTRYAFGCDIFDFVLPKIGGTSANDVNLAYCENVHHFTGTGGNGADAGAASWVPEYVNTDPTSMLGLSGGITGTGPDDMWVLGHRGYFPGACAVVLHKTTGGFETVADGTLLPDETCAEIPGVPLLRPLRALHATSKGHVVGVEYSDDVVGNNAVHIARASDGSYSISTATPFPTFEVALAGVWGASENDLWFLAGDNSGPKRILRGTNVWGDTASYQYSTLVMNGLPNREQLSQIRGTSNENLWVVGVGRAFHKTIP